MLLYLNTLIKKSSFVEKLVWQTKIKGVLNTLPVAERQKVCSNCRKGSLNVERVYATHGQCPTDM